MPTPLAFRASEEMVARLDSLCEATERDRSYHLNRALEIYVEHELWQIKAIQEGIEDARAGNLKPLDEVVAKWRERRDARDQ